MSKSSFENLSKNREQFILEHKATSRHIAKLVLSNRNTSMLSKLKLVKIYKALFNR